MTDQELIDIALKSRKITKCKPGKPLRATHWWSPDYRSATPKGITLVARKAAQRWAVR
jgi:hypothetical protein